MSRQSKFSWPWPCTAETLLSTIRMPRKVWLAWAEEKMSSDKSFPELSSRWSRELILRGLRPADLMGLIAVHGLLQVAERAGVQRVVDFLSMSESDFLQKYHG